MSDPAVSHPANGRLRGLRQSLHLTPTNLGRSVGVSGRTIRALEAGRYTPSVILACRIAQALGQPVEILFTA